MFKEELVEYFPLLLFGGGHYLQENGKAFRIRQCNVKQSLAGHMWVHRRAFGSCFRTREVNFVADVSLLVFVTKLNSFFGSHVFCVS